MSQADDAVAFARAQIGKPYKWAAAGPDAYDCSGLTMAAYAHANPPIRLTHFTGTQLLEGKPVSKADLQVGDLIFPDPGHVQLYSGNGQIIEAQQNGVPVREGPMWGFWQARRVANDGLVGSATTALSGVLGAVPNPLSAAASTVDVLRPFGLASSAIIRPQFWARIGSGALGVMLIFVGILYWNRRGIMGGVSAVARGTESLGSAVLQGAAFGAGSAGTLTGGRAASVTGVPATVPIRGTPRAPSPAAIEAAPRTAPLPEFESPVSPSAPVSPYRTYASADSGGRSGRRIRWDDDSYTGTHRRSEDRNVAKGVAKRPPTGLPGDASKRKGMR